MKNPPHALGLAVGFGAAAMGPSLAHAQTASDAAVDAPDAVVSAAQSELAAFCRTSPLHVLRAFAPAPDRYAVRRLYTWTTGAQMAGIRAGGALLTRSVSPERGVSIYDSVVADLAARGDRTAQTLALPRLRRARFAWLHPWPTRMGWEGEEYGDHLLRVELRADAWTVRLTGSGTFSAMDMRGEAVPLEEVSRHPERIGAVYFIRDGASVGGGGRYREYVLPNERMIAAWDFDDMSVRADVESNLAALRALRFWLSGCGDALARRPVSDAPASWRLAGDDGDVATAWLRALAMPGARYELTLANLDVLIGALVATPCFEGGRVTNATGRRRRSLDPRARVPPVGPPPRMVYDGAIGTYVVRQRR